MGKLEHLKLRAPMSWQAQRLSRWLHEWQLHQMLLQAEVPSAPAGGRRLSLPTGVSGAGKSSDSPPATGQIRLLRPNRDRPHEGPIFVATLATERTDRLTCIPFGRFCEPATPDELLTDRPQAVVRVLCLWNARTGAVSQLENSWLVDALTPREIDRLTHAVAVLDGTGSLPDDLREWGGPPLVHPDDPRRAYLRDERLRIDRALPEYGRACPPSVLRYPEPRDRNPDALPRAAEDPEDYSPL